MSCRIRLTYIGELVKNLMRFFCMANRRAVAGFRLRPINQFIQLVLTHRVDIHAWIILLFHDIGGRCLSVNTHTSTQLFDHMIALLLSCRYSLGARFSQYLHIFIPRQRRFNWCICWFILTFVIILASLRGYWRELILFWFFIHNLWSVESMSEVLHWSTESWRRFIFLLIKYPIAWNSSCYMAFNDCLALDW